MTSPGGFTPGYVLTSTDMNTLPGGMIATGRRVLSFNGGADQTGISSVTTVAGSTVTFTATANRLYRISAALGLLQVTGAGIVGVTIARGGSDIAYVFQGNVLNTSATFVAGTGWDVPGGGSVTYTLRAVTTANTLTIRNSQFAGHLVVTDAGPST